jgi:hypothetical protein
VCRWDILAIAKYFLWGKKRAMEAQSLVRFCSLTNTVLTLCLPICTFEWQVYLSTPDVVTFDLGMQGETTAVSADQIDCSPHFQLGPETVAVSIADCEHNQYIGQENHLQGEDFAADVVYGATKSERDRCGPDGECHYSFEWSRKKVACCVSLYCRLDWSFVMMRSKLVDHPGSLSLDRHRFLVVSRKIDDVECSALMNLPASQRGDEVSSCSDRKNGYW